MSSRQSERKEDAAVASSSGHFQLPMVPKTPNTARIGSSTSLVLASSIPQSIDRPNSRFRLQNFHGSSNWPNGGTLTSRTTDSSLRGYRPKPQLASDLEGFIHRELLQMTANAKTLSVFERIPVIGEAFGAFIARFPEYSELLALIKREYDEAVAEGMKAQRSAHRYENASDNMAEYFAQIMGAEKISFEAQLREKDKKVKDLELTLQQRMSEYSSSIEEHNDLILRVAALQKMNEELQSKNTLLSEGLKQETLHRSLMVQQGKKLKLDNEKLGKKVQMLEFKMKNDAILQATEGGPTNSGASRGRTNSTRELVRDTSSVQKSTKGPSGEDGEPPVDSTEEKLLLEERVVRLMQLLRNEMNERKTLQELLAASGNARIDRPMTPRPNWALCKSVFPKFNLSKSSTTSDETLQEFIDAVKDRIREDRKAVEVTAMSKTVREWMIDENLCESDLVNGRVRTFTGRGTGPRVPPFLKFHGQLRNRRLSKGDVENMLKDFWKIRKAKTAPGSDAPTTSIQTFFMEWLMQKTGSQYSAIELAYNIVDICEKFTHDPDCGMFLMILNDDVNESAYFDQLACIEQLLMVIRHHDKNDVGLIRRQRLHHILLKVFPAKSTDFMLKLRFALLTHLNPSNDTIRYLEIFEEDHEGNQSRFVELVREQHLREMTEYIVDFEEAIRSAVSVDGVLTVAMIRSAAKYLDANLPTAKLDAIIACGLDTTSVSPEMDAFHVEPEMFIQRIRKGILLMPHTRKDVDDDEAMFDEDSKVLEELLDDVELDESELDPATKFALQAMDKHLLASVSANPLLEANVARVKTLTLPSVVEGATQLLKPATLEAMQQKLKTAPSLA